MSTIAKADHPLESLALARDARIVAHPPGAAEPTLIKLHVWTRTQLQEVAAPGVDVGNLLKMDGRRGGLRTLTCGDRSGTDFERWDGLRCHFILNVRERAEGLETISYTMEVQAPKSWPCPGFLRWEYEPERKSGVSAVKEPQSHLHPGHDKIRIPAPVLSPRELIAVFLGLEAWG